VLFYSILHIEKKEEVLLIETFDLMELDGEKVVAHLEAMKTRLVI
jgi:hypothetical protein